MRISMKRLKKVLNSPHRESSDQGDLRGRQDTVVQGVDQEEAAEEVESE